MRDVIQQLVNEFHYVTSEIEDIEEKDYLKPAIVSNLICMRDDIPAEIIQKFVELEFLTYSA